MRKDLNKLLCERERWSSSNKFGYYRHMKEFAQGDGEEIENLPLREGMRKRYKVRGNWKTFGENLNPLLGFIRKSVGKRWDDSYSELCSVFDMNSVINQHIEIHLFQFVERNVTEENGILYYRNSWGGVARLVMEWNGPWYYIHPTTGILMENTARTSYKKYQQLRDEERKVEDAKIRRVISDKLELRKRPDGDIWFICEIGVVPYEKVFQYRFGSLDAESTFAQRYDEWDKEYVTADQSSARRRGMFHKGTRHGQTYVAKVRTASRKELKKYGII